MTEKAPPEDAAPLRVWFGFAAMSLGMFMAVLDIQIVVTSLPAIQQALGIGPDLMSWVQTSYLIAEVIAIPLTGILTRIFSLRYVFALAIGGFTLASVGCALSGGFTSLIVMRVLQGFCGGLLIPLVFSAIFTLFKPGLEQAVATAAAGVLAVLAPAFGPIGGGYITHHLSWHWLFLVNVLPGIASLGAGLICLPGAERQLGLLRRLDWLSLGVIAAGLAALEIGLKNAPDNGWMSARVLALLALAAALLGAAILRPNPVVEFRLLRDRTLAHGCAASFLLGASLFGAGYIMPVFLAFVRRHDPLEIGAIVLVTGLTQLLTAPIAVLLDRYLPPRPLAAIGFAGLAVGVAMSGFQDVNTDYDQMFWPQVVRGCFMALCMLPLTRLSLGLMPLSQVGDASGLYNLSRNLGGAIGIALADTVIFSRAPEHADRIADLVRSGAPEAARLLGMPPGDVPAPDDAMGMMSIMDAVQDAGLTLAINEAWLMFAAITAAAIPLMWMMGPVRKHPRRD
ncbi:MAG: DHA2 family efflux MFS transporter permease subunit [Aestuariivirga sp.]|nr:DHA2 family efflux MFS transporter permease subunit [Aestuariivirga sp.]MCA3555565.1 DHA2 family efflux MFS transporter permease subunit [Aestuariivirga sp.]